MAGGRSVFERSYKAETDLSTSQYRIVELSGTDQVDVCDNAADVPHGVLQNDPKIGEEATVMLMGVSKVVTDGTVNGGITVGATLGTGATGKAIRKSADADFVLGEALDASTADGVIIRILMTGKWQRAS